MVVITYCVEYAQSQKSVCQKCNKVIPNKSLRFGRMERQSEKEKKKFAKFTWYHFRCFEVPELLTKIPVHLIRGQVDLLDKVKKRISGKEAQTTQSSPPLFYFVHSPVHSPVHSLVHSLVLFPSLHLSDTVFFFFHDGN